MRTIYLDCGMGAAGDMLAAALLELHPDPAGFVARMNALGIPNVEVSIQKSIKCGITGTHFSVKIRGQEEGSHNSTHHHGSMTDIRGIVSGLRIPAMVKLDILAVYREIAEAESKVHGVQVNEIHFHEVGAMDAIADITAVCLLLRELDADRILASAVHVGSGAVRCAHGILPVPAPATAEILKGVPIYGGRIQGELCTPTGAALLKHFAEDFGDMPAMKVTSIGYGMGKKDFERANCIRALLGETQEKRDSILELRCNLDDMTGEQLGFALEQLLAQGALDAFTVPIGMKKSRPGILLTVLCREVDREKLVRLIFRHTTTLGIRENRCARDTLERGVEPVETPYGKIRRKVSTGYGIRRGKWEYEDLAEAARAHGLSLEALLKNLEEMAF